MKESRGVQRFQEKATYLKNQGFPIKWLSPTHFVVNEKSKKQTHYAMDDELARTISPLCLAGTVTAWTIRYQNERKYRLYIEAEGIDVRLQMHIIRDQLVEFDVRSYGYAVQPDSVIHPIFVQLEEWVADLPENRLFYTTGILKRERVDRP